MRDGGIRSQRRTRNLTLELIGLSVGHTLGLVVEGGDDLVGVLFRVVKSQAADREIEFMTVPRSPRG
jgi:hypothetical protein